MSDDAQYRLGKIEGRLDAVERDLTRFKEDFKVSMDRIHNRIDMLDGKFDSFDGKIDDISLVIRDTKTSAKASWKTLTIIGTIIVSIFTGGYWVFDKTASVMEKLDKISTHQQIVK